ncbi:UDP-N-acetylglucosamine 4,6-dehydratase [Idiomarina abyssalis]|uniref:UDP-N-acetylglucosamine 4,6-dehydratase n=1 Tax=Idiomarina TaxID=135575 RepID=UPI000C08E7EE|nr:UDP-N-acetylglucosamine 4,6-dehydratase [Idiomarina abyssalis]MAL83384.1 UDP-N-acetylglucosamine 4,6-dehydratase [Idiomarina sp.]MDA6066560.1 UDP-N-acetylglucosamine 4,6-dehydratase [Idiomarina abyssalis]
MDNILSLIGRDRELFSGDIQHHEMELCEQVSSSSFLVLGGAGSIGQAVVKEIFKRSPKRLHVVDISENNLVELVRDVRSSLGYINGDFKTFALDIGSLEFEALMNHYGQYDYVLNLSALKHVRSEKDPFTLMRMLDVNIFNTDKSIEHAIKHGSQKYFCVSTDKAANPVNMMGASKRIMEMFLMRRSEQVDISTARFANVAFSDGSLLHGFNQRIQKRQPIVAPNDIKRYFVTPKESGELCLMSCIFGENRDIFFPKLSEALHLITFSEIAEKYLEQRGLEPVLCQSEDEARALALTLPEKGQWPCLFTGSDTTGEKDFEEFFTHDETIEMERFRNIGVVKNELNYSSDLLKNFEHEILKLKQSKCWNKQDIIDLFCTLLPNFDHKETGKYLDGKM